MVSISKRTSRRCRSGYGGRATSPSRNVAVTLRKPGSEQGRPLGISCFEDKLVELALKRVLEPIYETIFEDSSHGYRPGCSQHGCLDALGRTIQQKRVNHVVEADIKSFFDKVNHEWMLKFLRLRIADPRIIRLIIRMLKGGILEQGLVKATEEGTPQGALCKALHKAPSPFKVTQTRSYFPARSLAVDTWGLLGYLSRLGRGFFGPRRCFRNFDNFTLAAS